MPLIALVFQRLPKGCCPSREIFLICYGVIITSSQSWLGEHSAKVLRSLPSLIAGFQRGTSPVKHFNGLPAAAALSADIANKDVAILFH